MDQHENRQHAGRGSSSFLTPRCELALTARNPLERLVAFLLTRLKPARLSRCGDLIQREFLFRCFYVPLYSTVAINFGIRECGITPLLLHTYAEYVHAMERMILEMALLRGVGKSSQRPPKTLFDLFASSIEGYASWAKRFEEWRASAIRSYRHFIRKHAPDMKKGGLEARAAYLGNLMQRGGRLPVELLGEAIQEIERDAGAFHVLSKNALKPQPARWGEPELDTWLIEIWPLVTRYCWNYYDVWQVAVAKAGDDADEKAALGKTSRIEDRCKNMLRLRLSALGSTKQGRPQKVAEQDEHGEPLPSPMPPLATLALGLRSIGMSQEDWILGGSSTRYVMRAQVL